MDNVHALKVRHQELEKELAVIDARGWLTPDEQVRRTCIKKEKLALKDRIAFLSATEPSLRAGSA